MRPTIVTLALGLSILATASAEAQNTTSGFAAYRNHFRASLRKRVVAAYETFRRKAIVEKDPLSLQLHGRLAPGDRVKLVQGPKVGFFSKSMKENLAWMKVKRPNKDLASIEVDYLYKVQGGPYNGRIACHISMNEKNGSAVGTTVLASNLRRIHPR